MSIHKSSSLQLFCGAVAATFLLSSCAGAAGSGESESTGGASVEHGAPKEEWISAFEDIEPIELRAQTPYPNNQETGVWLTSFLEEIEEWSGGKLQFEVGYSNAFVNQDEVADALADGRVDLALTYPHLDRQKFATTNQLISSTSLQSSAGPVEGTILSNVWPNQVAFNTDSIMEEYEGNGMKPLLPFMPGGTGALFCSDRHSTANEFAGSIISVTSEAGSTMIEALGAAPTAVESSEYYDALQRGVVDCVQTTPGAMASAGLLEVAPHATIDFERSFVSAGVGIAMSSATWEQLPLPAQQLIWDKIATLIQGNIESSWEDLVTANTSGVEAGGGVVPFDASLDAAFEDGIASIKGTLEEQADPELLQSATSYVEYWKNSINASDFGSSSLDDLDKWLESDEKSRVREYIADTVYTEVFAPLRPE